MRILPILLLLFCLCTYSGYSQEVVMEGYAFEKDRGYIKGVEVSIKNRRGQLLGEEVTNKDGHFAVTLKQDKKYLIFAKAAQYKSVRQEFDWDVSMGFKVFTKLPMERSPGYDFEITLADQPKKDGTSEGITGARIEVFNNTTEKEVLVLEKHTSPVFTVHFEPGNHYTIMVRKKGYFTKRMEAYVDVEAVYYVLMALVMYSLV